MPKPLSCPYCQKSFLSTTYGMLSHVQICKSKFGDESIKKPNMIAARDVKDNGVAGKVAQKKKKS